MSVLIPPRFPALDADAFLVEDQAFDGVRAGAILEAHNWLQAEPALCLGYVSENHGVPIPGTDRGIAPRPSQAFVYAMPNWQLLEGPIPIRKKPGHTKAELRAMIAGNPELRRHLQFMICSEAAPFPRGVYLQSLGRDFHPEWQSYGGEIAVNPGIDETLSLYVRRLSIPREIILWEFDEYIYPGRDPGRSTATFTTYRRPPGDFVGCVVASDTSAHGGPYAGVIRSQEHVETEHHNTGGGPAITITHSWVFTADFSPPITQSLGGGFVIIQPPVVSLGSLTVAVHKRAV